MKLNLFRKTLVVLSLSVSTTLFSQTGNISINKAGAASTNPAILDLSDASNAHLGFLMPNVNLLSASDIVTIPSPTTGMIVWNTNAGMPFGVGYYYWSGTAWLYMLNNGSSVGNYILNQNSSQQTANFWISGTASIGAANVATDQLFVAQHTDADYAVVGANTGTSQISYVGAGVLGTSNQIQGAVVGDNSNSIFYSFGVTGLGNDGTFAPYYIANGNGYGAGVWGEGISQGVFGMYGSATGAGVLGMGTGGNYQAINGSAVNYGVLGTIGTVGAAVTGYANGLNIFPSSVGTAGMVGVANGSGTTYGTVGVNQNAAGYGLAAFNSTGITGAGLTVSGTSYLLGLGSVGAPNVATDEWYVQQPTDADYAVVGANTGTSQISYVGAGVLGTSNQIQGAVVGDNSNSIFYSFGVTGLGNDGTFAPYYIANGNGYGAGVWGEGISQGVFGMYGSATGAGVLGMGTGGNYQAINGSAVNYGVLGTIGTVGAAVTGYANGLNIFPSSVGTAGMVGVANGSGTTYGTVGVNQNAAGYGLAAINNTGVTGKGLYVSGVADILGNLGTINNVAYTWPAAEAASNGLALTSTTIGGLSWSQINLTTAVTGILPIANGGTNIGTIGGAGSVIYSNGTQYASTAVGTAGQVLTSNGAGTPTWSAPKYKITIPFQLGYSNAYNSFLQTAMTAGNVYWMLNFYTTGTSGVWGNNAANPPALENGTLNLDGYTASSSGTFNKFQGFISYASIANDVITIYIYKYTPQNNITFSANEVGTAVLLGSGSVTCPATAGQGITITATPSGNPGYNAGDIIIIMAKSASAASVTMNGTAELLSN